MPVLRSKHPPLHPPDGAGLRRTPLPAHRADCVAHGAGSRGRERRRGRRDPPVGPAARARARGRSAAGSAQPASGAAGAAVSSSPRAAPGKGRLAGATCRAPGALPWPPGRPGSHLARVGSCYAATQPQAELARLVTSSPGAPRPCQGPRRTCRILDLARGPAPGPPRSSGARGRETPLGCAAREEPAEGVVGTRWEKEQHLPWSHHFPRSPHPGREGRGCRTRASHNPLPLQGGHGRSEFQVGGAALRKGPRGQLAAVGCCECP
ncbi:uncharacterized protein LOC112610151 [Theropithecus gelada]|uniref:uncharacterized protein LOC112610151 n=1 Tax=Theropithecus gelada TaxID=9565 RepID=UPI000DC17A80|nr:uncharacterized protein LOC112610151 [Theropithecus gelada]